LDESRLLRCGLEAAEALVRNEPFEISLAEALYRIVGADSAVVNVWRGRPRAAPSLTLVGQSPRTASELEAWARQFAGHPYFAHLLATGDPRPYRTSDFMPFHLFRQTAVYRKLLARDQLRHQLLMTLHLTDQDLVFVALLRRLHNFSDGEVGDLEQLRGPLSAALAYRAEVRAIQAKIRSDSLPAHPTEPGLTSRENQVLALIAVGCTNDQAAHRLGISTRTIRKHLEAVFAKAHVSSRAAAVAWWLRQAPGDSPQSTVVPQAP
jgi:DNA-binding CsgD family transcriptional regulator